MRCCPKNVGPRPDKTLTVMETSTVVYKLYENNVNVDNEHTQLKTMMKL